MNNFNNVNVNNFNNESNNKLNAMNQKNMDNNSIKNINKKNKSLIRVGIVSVFIIVVILILVIILRNNDLSKNGNFNDPFKDIDIDYTSFNKEDENIEYLTTRLNEDFSSGKISSDEYIKQLAYAIYDVNKINLEYSDLVIDWMEPKVLLQKANEFVNELSDETILYLFEHVLLGNVALNESDTNDRVSGLNNKNNYHNKITLLKEKENFNEKNFNVQKLDKKTLSNNGNFILYYTNKGMNAIDDKEVKKIADILENIVSFYDSEYNLDYQFEPTYGFGFDFDYVLNSDSAMPVYLLDISNYGALGFYLNFDKNVIADLYLKMVDLIKKTVDVDKIITTTYVTPFVVINTNSINDIDSTKITLAHELFHHYQRYICGDGEPGECKSGEFTTETTANYVSSVFMKSKERSGNNILNRYAVNYSKYFVSESLDVLGLSQDRLGYPTFVFAYNYAEIVSDGAMKLIESSKYENSLKYLYDNSGGKYKDVMLTLAKKNMTQDYDNQFILSQYNNKNYYPENFKQLSTSDNDYSLKIDYSSIQYFYVNPSKYNQLSQITFSSYSNDISLLLFVKDGVGYKHLYTHTLDTDFVINISDFANFGEVVFGIVNSSIVNDINYNVVIKENETKKATVTAESLNLTILSDVINNQSSFMCHQIIEDDDWYNIYQIKIGFDKNSNLNEMYFKGIYKFKDYNEENSLAFGITKKIVSGLLYATKKKYTKQFKYVDTIISEKTDEYSITFKIKKNYYEALKGSFSISSDDKLEIVRSIQREGFICEY